MVCNPRERSARRLPPSDDCPAANGPSDQSSDMSCDTTPLGSHTEGDANGDHALAGGSVLFISVIVPVRNEAATIRQTLGQLLDQQYDPRRYEVIVVDGQSDDGTPQLVAELAERYENVHLYANPRRLSSAARNIGIQHARGDVVVIVDGHCEIEDRQYLGKLAAAFETSGADCLGRPQPLDVTDATPLQRAIAAARASRLGHHPESFIYSSQPQFVPAKSVAVAYRREVFDRVGLFDERFDAHEDGELNYRCDLAGLRCYFTPEIAVKYHPRGTLRGLFRQMIRYGRGRIRFQASTPAPTTLGTLLPAAFVAGLIVERHCRWPPGGWPRFISPRVALYVAVIACGSARIALQPGNLPLLPVASAGVRDGSRGIGDWGSSSNRSPRRQAHHAPRTKRQRRREIDVGMHMPLVLNTCRDSVSSSCCL